MHLAKYLLALVFSISFGARADIVSSKGNPADPLPAGCMNSSGGTYGLLGGQLKSHDFPQLNYTELLACDDRALKKRYFRLRLAILAKNADGKNENLVADEVIIPWHKGINPRNLSVAEGSECVANETTVLPTELGPYAVGVWVQQHDDSLLLKRILSAWKIDTVTKSIVTIKTKNLVCTSGNGC